MATGVERLKADEMVGKTDPDKLLSESDKLHIGKDSSESELGGESDDREIDNSNASSGAHSAHVDYIESSENLNLSGLTTSKYSDVDDSNSDVTTDKQTEKEDEDFFEDFFEARVGLNQEPSEKIIPETDLVPEVVNTNDGQLGENLSKTTSDAKVSDIIAETENYNRSSGDSGADNEFYGSSESSNFGNDIHTDSSRTADGQVRVSASQEETVNEVHVGHIRGSAEAEDGSESSDTEGEYESADEGEEIQVDAEQLKDLEESLTEEQKEERRTSAQILKEEGNELFRCGSYKSAIKIYSRALRTCPLKFAKDRAIMYSNRAVCKMKLTDNEAAIRDCSKALDLHPHYMKALMRRAELYEKTEKLDEALVDYQKIVELDPSQHSARAACMRLPEQIKDRNEKMKAEMMDKLKDLGNLILRPFGLSTNNFQLNQNPDSGGYSVNFVQNPGQ